MMEQAQHLNYSPPSYRCATWADLDAMGDTKAPCPLNDAAEREALRLLLETSNREFESAMRDDWEWRKMDFEPLNDPVEDFLDDYFAEAVQLAYGDEPRPKKSLDQYNNGERQLVKEKCRAMGKEDPWSYQQRKARESQIKAVKSEKKEVRETDKELPPVKKVSQEFKILLQQARMASGLKQKDLAVKLKVTANVVSDWESGKALPSGAQRAALNRILKVVLPK